MFQSGCTHPVDLGQTERVARVREWVKKKTVQCRDKKIDGREQLQCDDLTRPDSDLRRFLLFPFSNFFFFVCLHPPATPHTCTAAQSKVKVTVFKPDYEMEKWISFFMEHLERGIR